mmetsp:Transcript_75530/g.209871  ORF Transcript_75530/g.209871 Transcript_75530/m.209871 type:complete len:347 (-) Transcript_75530:1398-2438(-)
MRFSSYIMANSWVTDRGIPLGTASSASLLAPDSASGTAKVPSYSAMSVSSASANQSKSERTWSTAPRPKWSASFSSSCVSGAGATAGESACSRSSDASDAPRIRLQSSCRTPTSGNASAGPTSWPCCFRPCATGKKRGTPSPTAALHSVARGTPFATTSPWRTVSSRPGEGLSRVWKPCKTQINEAVPERHASSAATPIGRRTTSPPSAATMGFASFSISSSASLGSFASAAGSSKSTWPLDTVSPSNARSTEPGSRSSLWRSSRPLADALSSNLTESLSVNARSPCRVRFHLPTTFAACSPADCTSRRRTVPRNFARTPSPTPPSKAPPVWKVRIVSCVPGSPML